MTKTKKTTKRIKTTSKKGQSPRPPKLYLIVPLLFAVLGSAMLMRSYAAPGGKGGGSSSGGSGTTVVDPATSTAVKIYTNPYTANVKNGSTVTVAVRMNTQGLPVNAVQADISYPTSKLEFVSLDVSQSALELGLVQEGGSGKVRIVRGSVNNVTGDQLIGTVTFKAIASKGSAGLTFLPTSSMVNGDTHKEVLEATFPASLKLTR